MVLPFKLDNYDVEGFLAVARTFGQGAYAYVVTPNVDHLIRWHGEPDFRAAYQAAAYTLLDSRFLSHLLRMTRGLRTRVCAGSDLTAGLFDQVIQPEDRIIVIGGDASQVRELIALYGLRNLQHINPPMGFIDDPAAVERCLRFVEMNSPFRMCFIAVGAPQQELLAQQLLARGRARGLALCVGAAVNFLTGIERRAPRWMQKSGTEWLYRLARDPQRLARRYLLRGPRVFALLRRTNFELHEPAVTRGR